MKKRFLCDDCKWAWRSCKHPDYPNATECSDYESRISGEKHVSPSRMSSSTGSTDRIDESGRIWRGNRCWDNKRGWRKPNWFSRVVTLLKGSRR